MDRTPLRSIAAILAVTLIALFGATAASAAPLNTPGSSQIETTPVALPPGDTIEVRSGIGAAAGVILGGLAGLPFFVIGAVPGAIIGGLLGAGIGAASWNIANAYS